MADNFLDTSALAKHYHLEAGTDVVEQVIQSPASTCFISRLTTVELHSVFARKVRTRELEPVAFQLLRQRFFADIVEGTLTVVRVLEEHYRSAQSLLLEHATENGLRTLDALQLAVAIDLHELGLLDCFVCSDAQLCAVATLKGMAVLNPEMPSKDRIEPESSEDPPA